MIAFHGEVVLPDTTLPGSWVVCEGSRIVSVGERPSASCEVVEGRYIAPGFVDIHVHGGDNADYMDGTVAAVQTVNRAHLRHGTTTIFPTTTTGSPDEIRRMLDACAIVQRDWSGPKDGSRISGVHYYGPYFAEDKVGCHALQGRRDPDAREYEAVLRTGVVRVATCAAELPGAEEFYRAARSAGCLVTCGHSNSTWTEMLRGYEAGVRHVDHFWCAMSNISSVRVRCGTPMQGSMEQFVLAYPEMSTEVIADGCHLAPELLEFAYRFKGAQRLCLVTDANRALDMPLGRYWFGPNETGAWFESDGRVGFVPGKGLASAVVGMDHMVRVMRAGAVSASLADVIRMASLTPAERAGVASDVGSLDAGKLADIVVLSAELRVQAVFIGGQRAVS